MLCSCARHFSHAGWCLQSNAVPVSPLQAGCDVIPGALLESPGGKKLSSGIKAEIDGLVVRDIPTIARPEPAAVGATALGGDAGGLDARMHAAQAELGELSAEVDALLERQHAVQARGANLKLSGWPKGGGKRRLRAARPTQVLAALVEAKASPTDLYDDLKKCDMLISTLQAPDGSAAPFSTMVSEREREFVIP